MLNQRSFSEILTDLESTEISRGHDETQSSVDFSAGWESHLDAFGLSQLMAEIQIEPLYNKVRVQRAYPLRQSRLTTPPKPAPVRPSHQLNEIQRAALQVLMGHCCRLGDNFNLHELKSAYRISALKTHPDQGGSSETFQEVKKSYQILLPLVKN